jgi:hypothetical protein
MGGAGSALAVFGLLVLIGLPVALSIRDGCPDWIGVAFESAVIGLIVELFVAIVLLHNRHYSRPTALACSIVIVGGVVAGMYHASRRRSLPRTDLSRPKTLEATVVALAAFVMIFVALRIRSAPSYFIFQTGDMGGYVNSANILTRAGAPFGLQPQGFTLFLRETNLVFGKARTVAGLPTLGAVLLLGIIAFARTIKLDIAAALGIAFIVLVHPVFVWFSLFPVSEVLEATLLVAMLYLVVRFRRETSYARATIAGLVAGSLLLVRGEAMLLAPIIVVVLLASSAVDDETTVGVQRRFSIVALVALCAAYAYDARYTSGYFRGQLRHLLPGVVFRVAEAHLVTFSPSLVFAGAFGLAVVLGAAFAVMRWVRPHTAGRPQRFWLAAYIAVILATALACAIFPLAGLADTLLRWGPLLLALVAIGVVVVVARPGRYLDGASGLMFLLVIAVYSMLFARRVHSAQGQANYLYFDRYLFSEVLPAALLLSTIGLQALIDLATHFVRKARAARIIVVPVMAVVIVGIVPQIHETERITQFRLLGNSYSAIARLDALTRKNGDPDHDGDPIVYSGTTSRTRNWTFPNTYRAFALPLRQTFSRKVFGIDPDPEGRDIFLRPRGARLMLTKHGLHSGYLVALRHSAFAPHYPDDDHTHYVGSVSYACPLLPQDRDPPPPAPWRVAMFQFDVYAIS